MTLTTPRTTIDTDILRALDALLTAHDSSDGGPDAAAALGILQSAARAGTMQSAVRAISAAELN